PDALWTEDITSLASSQSNPHVYFDPLVMMAVAGASTERIRVGSVVTDLIRRSPPMVANQLLTLDHLTRGRTILGVGTGEAMNILPYGLPFDHAVARFEEGLEVIRLLWRSEGRVSYQGRFHKLEDAVLGLQPYGSTPPEIWIAA